MLSIELIRKDPEYVAQALKRRGDEPALGRHRIAGRGKAQTSGSVGRP